MASPSVKHENLREVTVNIVARLAREVRTLTAMGLSAYENGVPTFGDDDTPADRIAQRMEAIEFCLRQIGSTADILVSAADAVARPIPPTGRRN